MAVRIRLEAPADEAAIRAVHEAAFGGPAEGQIVDQVRGTSAWLPGLSLVALDEAGDEIVGHVMACHGRLDPPDPPPRPILVLGPIAVRPDRQRQGIGSALMRRVIGAAVARAEPLVVLVGHADYYPRFGFVPARDLGLEPPAAWSDRNWLALRLPPWTPDLRGTVHFPEPYPLA